MWGDGSKLFNSNGDQVSFEGDDENSNTWDYSSSCCLKYKYVLSKGSLFSNITNVEAHQLASNSILCILQASQSKVRRSLLLRFVVAWDLNVELPAIRSAGGDQRLLESRKQMIIE